MRAPRHLWTGDWRLDTEDARESAEEAHARHREALRRAAAAREAGAAASTGHRNRSALITALAAAVAAVVGAFAVGMLVDRNGGGGGVAPLPAVAEHPLKPQRGRTVAATVYADASPAVVSIKSSGGEGTGFLISPDGKLVTNAHVVGSDNRVVVRFGAQGTSLDAAVVGVDASSDLAVLSIDPGSIPEGVKPLQFADSRNVQIGDPAIAIGNPFGLDRTATEGIVSGLGRHIQAPNGFGIDQVIQTDAPINPGNSGGPLLNTSAQVIGVNSQIATAGSNGNVGIGFAVPANTVRQVVPLLEKGQVVRHPFLGLSTDSSNPFSNGATVASVIPGGPADRAGIQQGDVITSVAGTQVGGPSDVSAAIAGHQPGQTVPVQVQRGGNTVTVKVKLGVQPRTP